MWCWELCRTSCVTGKHHTNWATSLTPFLPFCDRFRVNILYVPVLIIFRIYFIVNRKSLTWNFVMENWVPPIVFGWVWMCVCLCTYLSPPPFSPSLCMCICSYHRPSTNRSYCNVHILFHLMARGGCEIGWGMLWWRNTNKDSPEMELSPESGEVMREQK